MSAPNLVSNTASPIKDIADVLADKLRDLGASQDIQEVLVVDNRVLARITDGIYRRPSSALRELIFNAYDADATMVTIHTDSPRFERMEVVDNGRGMNERSLSNLLKHIGGSSKRTYRGKALDTVSQDDPDLSPGNRRLIGKIGIGLFAVAHLTTHFQIITKTKGESDWLIAEIWLKTFTEELLRDKGIDGVDPEFITGEVVLTRARANSVEEHGTTVTLFDIRKGTQNVLRQRERWESILEFRANQNSDLSSDRRPTPDIHIGFMDDETKSYKIEPSLPWVVEDSAEVRFRKFYECVSNSSQGATKNPDIDEFLDEYFAMIWRLSLAAPLPYLGDHPFETKFDDGIDIFAIENKPKGRAIPIRGEANSTVAQAQGLALNQEAIGFSIFVDGVKLSRPVDLPHKIVGAQRPIRSKNPILFVGKVKSSLGSYDANLSGGSLEFEAYFYWNSVIVPKQNRGVLVRINDASGVLYDDGFLDYQVSELNRLNQITCEVFVKVGMDVALNIDRESFNVSHPHYQYLSKWIHAGLLQITNLLKDQSKKGRAEDQQKKRTGTQSAVEDQLAEIWSRRGDQLEERPTILVNERTSERSARQLRLDGVLAYDVNPKILSAAKISPVNIAPLGPLNTAKAIFGVLAAYGVLDKLIYSDQESMFEDVLQVLMAEGKQ